MRNYSPNYIGLVKAAGMSELISNAMNFVSNRNAIQNQGLDITQTPVQAFTPQVNTRYNVAPDYVSPEATYRQWYDTVQKEYKKETQHQQRQQNDIQTAKRLTAEQQEKSQRDKQLLDQQRAYANQ